MVYSLDPTHTVELGGQMFTAEQWEAVQDYAKGHSPSMVQDMGDTSEVIHQAETGLNYMLGLQRTVEERWGRAVDPSDPEAVSKYIREVILCATDELHEVLAEVHWKPWKDSRGIKSMSNYREEMADVLHFILDLYLAAGLTGRDIVVDYTAKHYTNLGRTESAEYKES